MTVRKTQQKKWKCKQEKGQARSQESARGGEGEREREILKKVGASFFCFGFFLIFFNFLLRTLDFRASGGKWWLLPKWQLPLAAFSSSFLSCERLSQLCMLCHRFGFARVRVKGLILLDQSDLFALDCYGVDKPCLQMVWWKSWLLVARF